MNGDNSLHQSRRQFLKSSVTTVAGMTVIAPGILLYTLPAQARVADKPVTSEVRWGLLVDTTKCKDNCNDCVTACNTENGLTGHDRPESDAQWIRKVSLRDKLTGREISLPVMCQHCETPPCADVCPTGASFRRADGIVLVDKHICIGCRYCMMACPYKARSFVHETLTDQKPNAPRGKGTVEACTLCAPRVDLGQQPACVEACQKSGHQALLFGDLKDPNSALAQKLAEVATTALRADMRLNPGVRYQGL